MRHLLVATFHSKHVDNLVDITVVVGSAIVPEASKEDPQVIALAVPLSVIAILSICPLTGVPERLVVKEVIATERAVIS